MSRWAPTQRAEAIGIALAVGADKASESTGIPRRTISSWLARERPAPELDVLIAASRSEVADRLWQAVEVGASEVVQRMRDPKARLSDVSQALRVAIEAHALLTGGATTRSASLNVNVDATRDLSTIDDAELVRWLRQIDAMNDDELRAAAPDILPMIAASERLAADYLAGQPDAVALLDAHLAGDDDTVTALLSTKESTE